MKFAALLPPLLLLAACNRQDVSDAEPAPPPTEESANRLMGLAEQAAADAERNAVPERSVTQNLSQGGKE